MAGPGRGGPAAARRAGTVPGAGLPGCPPPVEVVLVVEGAARASPTNQSPSGVRVVAAPPGSGDDAIVDLVRGRADRPRVVVTADRGLRDRVTALGASVLGPRTLPYGPARR